MLLRSSCALILLLAACSSAEGEAIESDAMDSDAEAAEIVDNLHRAGFADDQIEVFSPTGPEGEPLPENSQVVVEGDIRISLEASRTLAEEAATSAAGEREFRHYHSYHLVAAPATICLVTVTAAVAAKAANKLSGVLLQAVAAAQVNLNNADLELDFRAVGGRMNANGSVTWDNTGCDTYTVIYRVDAPGNGGARGDFPAGDGGSGHYIRIYSGMETPEFTANYREHLVTHELGHTLGLRHTDWESRDSCDGSISEDEDPLGAVFIPGTPENTVDSIMAACAYEDFDEYDGELTSSDLTALRALY